MRLSPAPLRLEKCEAGRHQASDTVQPYFSRLVASPLRSLKKGYLASLSIGDAVAIKTLGSATPAQSCCIHEDNQRTRGGWALVGPASVVTNTCHGQGVG